MKHVLHILWFEVLRLRYRLIWFGGIILANLALHAWIVWGPPSSPWPPQIEGLLPILMALLWLTLVFISADLFLAHTPTGPRQPVLTQAIPRIPLAAAKLIIWFAVLGLAWAQYAAIVLWIRDSDPFVFWTSAAGQSTILLGCVAVGWLAAQSETPAGIPKNLALCSSVGIAALVVAWAILAPRWPFPVPEPQGHPGLSLLLLAPLVIGFQYQTRRRLPKLAVSAAGLFLLASSPYWGPPFKPRRGPQFPPLPPVVQGTARVSSRFEDDYGIVRLRWEPGLLDPDQFAIVANLSWADADGNLNARLAVVSNTDQLAALHRACVEGTGHLGTEARVPFAIASAAKSAAKEAFTGGEAILRVFRLERLSVTLAPGETERFFRYHGRNHQISLIRGLKGSSGRIVKPCIDSMLQPWAVDRKLSIPAAIRATAPDSLPKWFFPELTSVGEPSEFSSDLEFYARDPVPEDASLEFFVNHPVRVIRVALVLEGIDTPPDPRLAPEHGSRK